ncbi:hypothetical protein ACN38_g840 [Penicillium nordicum]|uniref:Uncharacterized protein n=1 Tax=Penicillium nordicum TaxID=229535 RepID=A0A0M8PI84_9EURO|nr:hypothetical protein ACN38_g840 [Penicillium nordicum]
MGQERTRGLIFSQTDKAQYHPWILIDEPICVKISKRVVEYLIKCGAEINFPPHTKTYSGQGSNPLLSVRVDA